MKELYTSKISQYAESVTVGEDVLLNGYVYTGDAVHKKFAALIAEGKELPIDIRGAVIHNAGPTPWKNKMSVGSCGPTMWSRMDKHTPMLFEMGLGGADALCANCIESCEVIAFDELGCESLKKMRVEKFYVFVAIDCHGGNIFERK